MSRSRSRLLVIVVIGALFGVACGSSSGGGGDAQAKAVRAARDAPLFDGPDAEVVAIDNKFEPEVFKVRVGTEVTFTNEGRLRHNVIPVPDGDFEIPTSDFAPGDEQSFTFTEVGTFRYYCSLHGTPTSGMIGTLAVVK